MYCKNCGHKLNKTSKFCVNCGKKVGTGTVRVLHDTATSEAIKTSNLNPVSRGKRFSNVVLDYVGYLIFAFAVGLILGLVGLYPLIENMDEALFGILIYLAYYLLFETIWSKSPAKFITKTRVIKTGGGKPDLGNIFRRTLSRFIPFEAFSFLSQNPVGWHDRFSGTLVVEDR